MGSISPCVYDKALKIERLKHVGKIGQHFPLFYDDSLKIEWPQNIIGENWAAFPPVFMTKFWDLNGPKNVIAKIRQHFLLFFFYDTISKNQMAK